MYDNQGNKIEVSFEDVVGTVNGQETNLQDAVNSGSIGGGSSVTIDKSMPGSPSDDHVPSTKLLKEELKKKADALPPGTSSEANQVAYTNPDGSKTNVQEKLTELDEATDTLSSNEYGTSSLTATNVDTSKQIVLKSFGKMVIETSNQLMDDTIRKTWTGKGVTISLGDDGYFSLSGTCTATLAIELVSLPTDEGNYIVSLDSVTNPNNLGWQTSLLLRKNGSSSLDKKANINASSTIQYSNDSNVTSLSIGVYIMSGQVVDGVKFRVMVNSGTSALPYEHYQKTITFPITSMTLGVGSKNKSISIDGGLKAFPIAIFSGTNKTGSTANTRWTNANEFTFSDTKGNIYISDSVELQANVLKVIRRVGSFTYNSAETTPIELLTATDGTPINYYSSSSQGLANGATIYYPLATPTEQCLGLWNITLAETLNVTNSSSAYMYLAYSKNADKTLGKFKVTELSSYTTISSALWGMCYAHNYLYVGGVDWVNNNGKLPIYKFGIANNTLTLAKEVNVDSHNKVTCIFAYDNYIYVVTRSQTSATVVDSYGEAGNLFIFDKDLTLQKQISLLWKGCDAKVYKGYLYVMEQMGRFEVFDISNPINPTRVYAFDSAESKEILSDGTENAIAYSLMEHQHLDCWTDNGVDYMTVGGFEFGTHIYNISNPLQPSRLGTFNLSKRDMNVNGMTQTFAVHSHYPCLYACVGMANADKRFAHNIPYGVMTLPIDNASTRNYNTLPSQTDEYILNNIPEKYKSDGKGEGDCHPSRMLINGDFMVVNCGKNLAIYRIENEIPMFKQIYNLGVGSADGFCAINDNTIAIGSGMASGSKFVKLLKIE